MIYVHWPRGAAHTRVSSVQLLGRRVDSVARALRTEPTLVYIGMPGRAARAAGITDDIVGPFGKPWACLSDPNGWRYAYAAYLKRRLADDPAFREAVRSLHGKTLICWCKGGKRGADPDCHGDLLAEFAERLFHSHEEA